uniref:Uncharacterized protein n=1 Tax=Arundo donax TaxID=35708 RepID=A0A0A9FG13_ARUDO
MMAPTKKTVSEAAGISKPPVRRSMVVACSTEKVIICAYMVQNRIVVAHTGISRATIFTSSTRDTEQSFHGLGAGRPSCPTSLSSSPAITAALSRHGNWAVWGIRACSGRSS